MKRGAPAREAYQTYQPRRARPGMLDPPEMTGLPDMVPQRYPRMRFHLRGNV